MTKNYKLMARDVLDNVKAVIVEANSDDLHAAIAAIDTLITSTSGQGNMTYSKARKSLTPVRNTLLGIASEVETDGISLSSSVKEHTPRLKKFARAFIEESKKIAEASKYKDVEQELRRKLQEHDGKAVVDTTARDMDILLRYRKLIKRLPQQIGVDDFTVVRAPVIPLFNKIVTKFANVLSKMFIDFDQIDFYYILKDQYLIAINSEKDITFAQESLSTINEASSTQYVMVSDRLTRHPNADVSFAWIMEKSLFNRLMAATGTFSVSRWSFPVNFRK